ncbi:MAG TPA: PQQ-dependent sugar dehydrogenase, partial [Pirellulaceae bacterium]|nr:PQQ-dependent sugar dehydrogenase [Pirellulaceae bacterium]
MQRFEESYRRARLRLSSLNASLYAGLLILWAVANGTFAPELWGQTPKQTANEPGAPRPTDARPLTADPLPDGTVAAERQIAALRMPAGMRVELFAAEPKLGNPVAIGLDERNRVFVAEEYRFNRGTEENRTRSFLLDDDLQARTLDDRRNMYRKHLDRFTGGWEWFTRYTDQIRLLEDTDRDGRADRSTVFDDGFHGVLDGLAAGVMARDGDVWVTCIPHLWRLRDTDGDGRADQRESLLEGFGVNAGFLGHDLHGLVWGPDGRLYFSVGDRGFHVRTREGKIVATPRRGAVFRCWPDGRELEVVHTGLRNPQEIAFDKFGNLFAADNNCDRGDYSRLVYVVDGGDSGWNMA